MNTPTEAVMVKVNFWSVRERIGRIRYAAYSFGVDLICALVYAVLFAAAGSAGPEAPVTLLALPVALFTVVMQFIFAIRRLHDMKSTGWLSLLLLVPLLNFVFALVLLFAPGSDGDNRFGPKPPPNHLGLYLLAFSAPAVFFFGIVLSVAIPSFMSMSSKAAAIEGYEVGKTLSTDVMAFELEHQKLPTLSGDIPAPDISHLVHVGAVSLDEQGVIKVSLKGSADIDGKSIVFLPQGDANGISGWQCVSDLPANMLPPGCQPAN